jgi:hypothetical protein
MNKARRDFDKGESVVRPDEETTSGQKEERYAHYAPAVRYGIALATLERYYDKTWAEIEREAQRGWEEKQERPWEEFEVLVRQAWEETRSQPSDTSRTTEDRNSYEAAFREHYQTVYAHRGYSYREYAPAYHFGYDLAIDEQLRNKTWEEIAPRARRYWENQGYAGFWEDFEEAVHYGWKVARDQVPYRSSRTSPENGVDRG